MFKQKQNWCCANSAIGTSRSTRVVIVVVVMATSVTAAQTKTENRHLQTNRRQLKNGRGDIFTKTNES